MCNGLTNLLYAYSKKTYFNATKAAVMQIKNSKIYIYVELVSNADRFYVHSY